MSEEKELGELDLENPESSDDMKDFVDFADFGDLGDLSNITDEDVFGDLGDLSDLGELPDLSDIESFLSEQTKEINEAQATAQDEEMVLGDIPGDLFAGDMDIDLFAENVEQPVAPEDISEAEEPVSLEDMLPEAEELLPETEEPMAVEELLPETEEPMAVEELLPETEEPMAVEELLSETEEPMAVEGLLPETEEPMAVEELLPETEEPMAVEELLPETEEPMKVEDILPEAEETVQESDKMEPSDLLDGLDLEFDSAEPAMEENVPQTENIDDMLGGLLDGLDMSGTMEEPVLTADDVLGKDIPDAESTDSIADLLGLNGEEPLEGEDALFDAMAMMPEEMQEKKTEEKPGFFKRVFGNIVTDEIAQAERDAAQKEEEQRALQEEEAAKNKEELEIKKAEKKAQKEAKAAERKKAAAEKKAQRAIEKAEKKAQREEEEAAELEVIGKLNKVGVCIIAIATILFLTVEIVGTNVFGYLRTKNKAMDYFEMGKYTEAYAEAIGTSMKEKNPEEYDKIKVVMQVQQSLNAYENYDRMKYYPEALNALLIGIKKYDANIEQGMSLEVEDDMMACRKRIITILNDEYGVSEAKAYSMLAMEKSEYESKVVEIGLEKVY